jgi:hypothetical protein
MTGDEKPPNLDRMMWSLLILGVLGVIITFAYLCAGLLGHDLLR